MFSSLCQCVLILFLTWYVFHYRKEGQDTSDELQKRNLREELEERERRHFSSKEKNHGGGEKNYSFVSFICALL